MIWLCLRQHPSEASVKISSESDLFWLIFREDFRVCLLLFYLVWFETISMWRFCESFIKIWFVLDGFREDLVLVWFGMVRFGLRQHPSEAFVKFSSRSNLFWMFWRRFTVGLVWYSLVWSSLRLHPSEDTVKIKSRSNLFCLF